MKILILDEPNQLTLVLKACLNTYYMSGGNAYQKHTITVALYNPKKPPHLVIGTKKPDGYEGIFLSWDMFPSPIKGSTSRGVLNEGLKQVVKEKADESTSTGSKKTNKEHSKNSTVTTDQETTVRKRGRPRGSRSSK